MSRIGGKIDLGQTRDAGPHSQPVPIAGDRLGQHADELRPLGTRAHQRHLAFEDVEKLRQLVQMELAKHVPQERDPRIVRLGPHRAGGRLGVLPHGADLVHQEPVAVLAYPRLSVYARSPRREPHQDHQQRDHGQTRNEQRRGQAAVDRSLPAEVKCGGKAGLPPHLPRAFWSRRMTLSPVDGLANN